MPIFFIILLVTIPVASADETICDETFNIDPWYYHAYYTEFDEGDELVITIEVTSAHDLEYFGIMDSSNFAQWQKEHSAKQAIERFDVISTEIVWKVPYDDVWYFVLSNFSSSSVTVHFTIVTKTGLCLSTIVIVALPLVVFFVLAGKKWLFS